MIIDQAHIIMNQTRRSGRHRMSGLTVIIGGIIIIFAMLIAVVIWCEKRDKHGF